MSGTSLADVASSATSSGGINPVGAQRDSPSADPAPVRVSWFGDHVDGHRARRAGAVPAAQSVRPQRQPSRSAPAANAPMRVGAALGAGARVVLAHGGRQRVQALVQTRGRAAVNRLPSMFGTCRSRRPRSQISRPFWRSLRPTHRVGVAARPRSCRPGRPAGPASARASA